MSRAKTQQALVAGGARDASPPAVRERPILFQGRLVRSILAGQKTVTRRPVKGTALEWLVDRFTPDMNAC